MSSKKTEINLSDDKISEGECTEINVIKEIESAIAKAANAMDIESVRTIMKFSEYTKVLPMEVFLKKEKELTSLSNLEFAKNLILRLISPIKDIAMRETVINLIIIIKFGKKFAWPQTPSLLKKSSSIHFFINNFKLDYDQGLTCVEQNIHIWLLEVIPLAFRLLPFDKNFVKDMTPKKLPFNKTPLDEKCFPLEVLALITSYILGWPDKKSFEFFDSYRARVPEYLFKKKNTELKERIKNCTNFFNRYPKYKSDLEQKSIADEVAGLEEEQKNNQLKYARRMF